MKLNVLSQNENETKFLVEDVDATIINTLRRAAIVEVPTLAIEEVEFLKNSSVMYDEMIALRLGLIPLKTDLKTYRLPSECRCKGKGCNLCQVKMTLSAKGPVTVYAKDLKIKDRKIVPIYPDMPIVKLDKGQELKIRATAVLGLGKEHTKWSPGLMTFQGYPNIRIDQSKCKNPEECAAVCPRDVYEVKDKKIKIKNLEACNLCKACEEKCPDCITIEGEPQKFIVTLEAWGQLEPKEILTTAVSSLSEKFKEFGKAFK